MKLLFIRAAALPLLPLDKVEDYWLHTLENAPDRQDCTRVTDYVTETWMNGRFSPPTLNHYQTEGPRTNNHLEGWHNKLKKRVKITHPSIYAIIKEVKKEQTANEAKMLPYAAGGKRRKTVKRYQEVEERPASENSSDIWRCKNPSSMEVQHSIFWSWTNMIILNPELNGYPFLTSIITNWRCSP